MDKDVNHLIIQSIRRMPYCLGRNLTDTDVYYYKKIYFEKGWPWWLNHLGTFVVFLVGFCGNFLSLFVLCRRRLRRSSYTQYLIALAVADTGAIFCEAFSAFVEIRQHQNGERTNLIPHTVFTCKFYYYIRYIFYSMSSWIIVALAIERLVAVKFPLWSKYVCSVLNARRILVLLLLFTMIIQSYHFLVKGIDCSASNHQTKSPCRCKTLRHHAELDIFLTIYLWRLMLMTLLPLTIIITVNILIMSKLFNENSLVDYSNATDNAKRKSFLLYRISRMLVIVSSIYLILHVPGSTLEIMKFIFGNVLKICNMRWHYYIHLSHHIFDLLTNFNYGINFYLYIISGKHIRKELVRIFQETSKSKTRRSSYFMSSFVHGSKQNPTDQQFILPFNKRPNKSSSKT